MKSASNPQPQERGGNELDNGADDICECNGYEYDPEDEELYENQDLED